MITIFYNLAQKRILLISLLVFIAGISTSAQGLSLETCLSSAENQMPLMRQKPELEEVLKNKLLNYSRQYLPQFVTNGQYSYQSDVPSLGISLPGIPALEIPKNQYRIWLDFSQPVWDAGLSSAQKKMEQSAYQTNLLNLDLGLHEYKKQVVQVFFQALIANRQMRLVEKTLSHLNEKKSVIESGIRNGIFQENDLLKIETEILSQEKKKSELESYAQSSLELLALFTGLDTRGVVLADPDIPATSAGINYTSHPEMKILEGQRASLQSSLAVQKVQRMPKIYLYGQAGLGSPNPYNFFKSQTSGFFMAGLRASWTVWDWGKFSREKNNLSLTLGMLDEQSSQKEMEIRARVIRIGNESRMLQDAAEKDRRMLDLRKRIRENASVQFDQGVISATLYLDEVLAEQLAALSVALDECAYLRNQYLLLMENGTL